MHPANLHPPLKKLRWGFLSTARINHALLAPLRQSRRSELAAVASRTLERAREAAREYGIDGAYGSYEELLADPQIDVIYNSLPNHLHAEWTIRALQAGKHVLVEKPLALTLEEVRAIQAAAAATGRIAVEALMYRHHPQTLKIQELLRSGALGEIRTLQGTFTFPLTRPDDYRWLPEQGGGSLWDVGCYPVSFCRMVAGAAPLRVHGQQVLSPGGVDLTFSGQMEYSNGILAQFTSSSALPYHTFMEICGSKASLYVPLPFNPPERHAPMILKRGRLEQRISTQRTNLYLGEVEDMERCILDGASPRYPLEESLENIETILRLYQSAK